jgi:hypothetical protein
VSSVPIRKRATSLDELRERRGALASEASLRRGISFRPRSTDVLIATYPKCGTTWLQQIVHGLRTRGSMDFDEITAVVPWIELAFDLGINLDASQVTAPRVFKTHLTWSEVPKGARYIYALRDPKDVLVSVYHFHEGWRFEPGTIPIGTFAREFFMSPESGRRYWRHVASWWEQRHRPKVLMLFYEDMKADLRAAIQSIARFIGCELDENLLEVAARQSSIEFMKAHGTKFDDHLVRRARNAARSLPPGGDSSKVRNGRVGDHLVEIPKDVSQELDLIWREEIETRLGLPCYEAMREQLTRENDGMKRGFSNF